MLGLLYGYGLEVCQVFLLRRVLCYFLYCFIIHLFLHYFIVRLFCLSIKYYLDMEFVSCSLTAKGEGMTQMQVSKKDCV